MDSSGLFVVVILFWYIFFHCLLLFYFFYCFQSCLFCLFVFSSSFLIISIVAVSLHHIRNWVSLSLLFSCVLSCGFDCVSCVVLCTVICLSSLVLSWRCFAVSARFILHLHSFKLRKLLILIMSSWKLNVLFTFYNTCFFLRKIWHFNFGSKLVHNGHHLFWPWIRKGQCQRSNNVFSCKCISSQTIGRSNTHRPYGVEANSLYELDPKVKVKGQIIYFLVNASPPKLLDVTTPNSSSAQVTWCRGYCATFVWPWLQGQRQGQIEYFHVNASLIFDGLSSWYHILNSTDNVSFRLILNKYVRF